MAVILIVDDRPPDCDFLITLLKSRGHRLLEAADGAEALQVARAVRPDLIVSDILMPLMDGYEFVRRLRADTDLAHTPVIFSTADYLDHEAKALARQCGVSVVLPKPCEPDLVLSTVDAALALAPVPDTSPQEVFFLYDTDSAQMLYVSPAYEQIWERSVQALYEQMADFIDAVHPDDRPGVYAMIEQLKQGENSRMAYRIVRPNKEERWILARAFPFQSGTPSVYRVAGFAEDITERKQAEAQREQLQAQLFEAQKMEAAGASARAAPHRRPGRAQAAARLAPRDHRHPSTPRYDREHRPGRCDADASGADESWCQCGACDA